MQEGENEIRRLIKDEKREGSFWTMLLAPKKAHLPLHAGSEHWLHTCHTR